MSDLRTEPTNARTEPLRVLLMSVWHPELYRGGAQQIAYETFKALQKMPGVEPTFMAAVDRSMASLYKSGARITGFDGRKNEFLFLSQDYDHVWQKLPSSLLVQAYSEFLTELKPDVVHFHHFMLFGIDLVTLTRRLIPSVRIVFTFHEFLAICPADGQMLRKTDQSLCTKASSIRCHQCLPDYGPEHYFVRETWMKRHLESVDVFTVPSAFMIDRFVEWGLPRERFAHVTNGQPDYSLGSSSVDSGTPSRRNRFGFFGQLVDNKGVWVVLDAIQKLRSEGFTDFTFEINGDNLGAASEKRRQQFEAFVAAEAALPASERILVINGSYSVDQLPGRMSRIDWCITPSVWWEIFGLVISEAWMFGKPVIASNVGGPGERITHEKDGLLFDVADASDLAKTIRRACTEEGLWDKLNRGITKPVTEVAMANAYLHQYEPSHRGPSPSGVVG
jgi:glycosyltransferase involved in cell wall biosynthesis